MIVSYSQLCKIRELINKVDLEDLIGIGAPPDEYESEIQMILKRITEPEPKEIEKIIREVFREMFGENPDNPRYVHIPKLSSDIYRVLILPKPKRIDNITIYYHSVIPDNSNDEIKDNFYSEQISIDRNSEEIIYKRALQQGRSVTNTYYIPHYASSFIDEYSLLFQYFGEDNSKYDEETPTVEIAILFEDKSVSNLKRSYNRYGVPREWEEFIDDLGTLLYSYGWFGDLFARQIFGKGVLDDEYIFLSVTFNEYGKEYYYLTDDDTIVAGDFLEVPVGDYGTIRKVRVEKKEYFKLNEVPMPLEKVKHIIGKCQENEYADIWDYDYGDKIKITCVDGQVLQGEVTDLIDGKFEDNERYSGDSIVIDVEGNSVEINKNNIKHIEVIE